MGKKVREEKKENDDVNIAFKLLQSLLAILIFLAIWEIMPRVGVVKPIYLPPFSKCVAALIKLAVSKKLFVNVGISLARAGIGFGIAVVVGIPLGILIGLNRTFERFVTPLLEIFRQLSPLSLLPVFILLLGIGEDTKVLIVLWGTFWAILMNTIVGVRSTPTLLVKMSKSMGASQLEVIRNVIIPSAAPEIFAGLRLSATIALLMLTAAEMVGANTGIGYFILYSQRTYNIPNMYASIITLAILGLLINFILLKFEKRALHWRESVPK